MASVVNPTHPAFLATKTAAGLRTQELPVSAQQQLLEQDLYDEAYQGLFCKALYDYTAQDASALSFRRGDIIEVLNRQPSGWWDGLLGEERGWFPSNYVTIISLEEAELAFSGSDYSNGDGMAQSDSDTGVLGMSETLIRGQAQNEEWLESEIHANNHLNNSDSATPQGSQTNDFWEPNIMEDGRVCI
jgi:son of sevenless-like protein